MHTQHDASPASAPSNLELLTDEILSAVATAATPGSRMKMSEMDPHTAALLALTDGLDEFASRGPSAAEASFAPLLRLIADHLAQSCLVTTGRDTHADMANGEMLTALLRISITDLCLGYEPEDGEGWGFVEAALALHELLATCSPGDPMTTDSRLVSALGLAADGIDAAKVDLIFRTLAESGPIVVRRPGTKPVAVSRGRH